MKISNKLIVGILSLGLIFLIFSTINYAYRIPELDQQISEKKSYHDFILQKFYIAEFGYTNIKVDQSLFSLLSVMLNISDIRLNNNGTKLFFDYRKNNERHIANENEAEIFTSFFSRYDGNQKQILRNYCLAKVNCSISQFDNIIIHNFTETVKPLLKDVEKNLQLTKGEITDLEKEKQNILYRSLIFQILGISLSQIAIIMQIIKDNN